MDREAGIYHKFLQFSVYTLNSLGVLALNLKTRDVFFCDTLYYPVNGGLCETKCTCGSMGVGGGRLTHGVVYQNVLLEDAIRFKY